MSAKAMLLMLVLLPTASALGVQPVDVSLATDPLDGTTAHVAAADPVGAVDGTEDAVVALVEERLACRDAVEVPLRGWAGRYVDERSGAASWLDVREVTHRVLVGERIVDPLGAVDQAATDAGAGAHTVDGVADALGATDARGPVDVLGVGDAPPVLDARVVPVYESHTHERAYRVDATWTQRFLDWDPVSHVFLLSPAAGFPYLADGGRLVQVCDDRPVLSALAPPAGYDRWSFTQRDDRWVLVGKDVDVRAAGPEDEGLPRRTGHCPLDVVQVAHGLVDDLVPRFAHDHGPGPGDAAAEIANDADASSSGTHDGASPQSAGVAVTSGLAAGALGVLALVAVAAAMWLRRRG